MFYVAVDQHSKQLTVSVRDESGDVLLRRQVSTEWKRVRLFWEEISGAFGGERWVCRDLGGVWLQ